MFSTSQKMIEKDIDVSSYQSVVTELNTKGAYNIWRWLLHYIRFNELFMIKSDYTADERKAILEKYENKAGIIVLPEDSVKKEKITEFLDSLDKNLYPYVSLGYYLGRKMYHDNGFDFGTNSLSVELIGLEFDEIIVFANKFMNALPVNMLFLKDEKEKKIYKVSK